MEEGKSKMHKIFLVIFSPDKTSFDELGNEIGQLSNICHVMFFMLCGEAVN